MERDNPNVVEKTAKDIFNYVNLRSDKFNLSILENLSVLFSTLFSVFIVVVLSVIALLFFAAALTWGLSVLLGSFLLATLIMGSIFTIAAIIVYTKRDTLIVNKVVCMLSKMMSDINKKYTDYD